MSDQSGNCTGQHQKLSEMFRCPTVISCSVSYAPHFYATYIYRDFTETL